MVGARGGGKASPSGEATRTFGDAPSSPADEAPKARGRRSRFCASSKGGSKGKSSQEHG